MALKVAEVLIKWRSEGTQQAEADTKKLGSALTDIGNKAKTAGALLSAGLTAPLLLIGKQAIDAASDLNESMSAVETVFGSTADQVVAFSRTAASQLGQSRQAALGAAAGMGALFKGVGLTEQQMADFSTSLLSASSDLGSFYNVDPGQVLDNLRSGLVGEAEPLRKFGILLTEDAVKAKGLELGLADANGELSEGAKVRARYALITEQLGAAEGDFARTSDGLANSQRVLAARLQDIRAEIGGYLLPYALKASAAFSDLLDRFMGLSDQAKGLGIALGAVAAAAGPVLVIAGQLLSSVGSLAPVFGALTGPLGLVALAVVGLGVAFKENWFGIRDTVGSVVSQVGEIVGRMSKFFQAATDRGLNPFAAGFRAVIVSLSEHLGESHPAVEFFQGLYRNIKRAGDYIDHTLRPALSNLFSAITTGDTDKAGDIMALLGRNLKSGWDKTGGAFLGEVKAFAATFLANLVSGFQSVNWDLIGNAIREGLTTFAGVYGEVYGKALAFAGSLVQNIVQGFQGINWDLVGSTVMSGLQSALTALSQLGGWILDRLKEVDWNGIAKSAADLAKFIGVMINTGVRNGVLGLMELGAWILEQLNKVNWQGISDDLMRRGQDASSGFQRGIQSVWDLIIAPWFQDLGTNLQAYLAEAGTWLLEKGKAVVQGLLDGIVEKFLAVASFFQNIGTSITNALPKDWGDLLYNAGTTLVGGLISGIGAQKDAILNAILALIPTDIEIAGQKIPIRGGGGTKPPKNDTGGGGGGGEFRAMGGPLGRRFTMVGEYGPELLINRSLVMPHGAAQSRIQAMGGMAYGGTGSWGSWLAAQDAATRARVRSLRASGQLNAAMRRDMMGGGRVAEDGSRVGAGYYNRDDQRRIRESARNMRRLDRARTTAGLSSAERQRYDQSVYDRQAGSDALHRANAYLDRTGDDSRINRVLARETRNGSISNNGLSRQEKQYLISNHGTINVYAKDSNVARAIGDELSSRNR